MDFYDFDDDIDIKNISFLYQLRVVKNYVISDSLSRSLSE